VNYLRRKLDDTPPGFLIRTVRGKGYMIPFETELVMQGTENHLGLIAPQIATAQG
jgi:DNA-binding winged helix-turn-helix (wHTH) protein